MGRVLLGWIWAAVIWAAIVDGAQAADHPVTFPSDPFPAAYSPSSVEAGVGDTVTFGGAFASHPLVWNDGDFATQSSGTTNTYTFLKPGTFRFHCAIHATMTGVVHVPGDQTATPSFTYSVSGSTVSYVASGSDPDGTIARFEWDLDGNGTFETIGATPSKTYTSSGTITVRLRYVDDGHETSPATSQVLTVVGSPPPSGGGGGGGGGGAQPPSGGGGTGGGGAAGSPSPSQPGGGETAPSPSGGGGGQGDAGGAGQPGLRVVSSALAFRHGRATVALRLPRAGAARVRLARSGTTLAAGTASRLAAGSRHVTVKLTRAGTRALRAGQRVKVTLTVTLKPRAGGAALTAHRTATVRAAR